MNWRYTVLVCMPLAWGLSGCREQALVDVAKLEPPPPLAVDVVSVVKSPIDSSIELTGTLFPWKFATIASEVTGVIESISESGDKVDYEIAGKAYSRVLPLDIGHQVQAGDVLIKISSSEAELALRLAEAKKAAMEMELANLYAWKRSEEIAQLKAQCEECEAVLVDAQADLSRATALLGRNAISKNEVEDARRSVATAAAGKKRTEAALELATAGPTAEQIAVAQAQLNMATAEVALKRDLLDKCTIRCPLESASIVERYVGAGDHVTANPSTPLMRIVDSSILMAQINVPQRYQGLVKPHDMATLTAEGNRATESDSGDVQAMVVLVNAQIDPETRTFRVRVGIDNSRNEFKAGTFVKVKIPIQAASDAVVVPSESITFTKGEPAAFVVKDGVVERRPVVLGISNRTHYQVISGLSETEQVVTGDLSLLATGLRVQPQSPATASPTIQAVAPAAPAAAAATLEVTTPVTAQSQG